MRAFVGDKRGGVAILFAMALPVLAIAAAGGVELARLNVQSTRFQEAADASALAGVLFSMNSADSDGVVKSRTEAFARPLIGAEDMKDATVKVTLARGSEPSVTVEISRKNDLMFGRILPVRQATMTRRATAVGGTGLPVCLLILDPDDAGAWSMQGTPDLMAPSCIVQVNSTSPDAIATGGSASATTRETRVVAKTGHGKPDVTPAPRFQQSKMVDPFAAAITWPSPGACDYSDGQVKKASKTLSPGVYCGGIGAETHGELTLEPGVYVIKTGGLTVSSGGQIKAPKDVTIVLVDPEATIDVHSKGSLQVKAPTSGMWKGIAIAVKPQPTRKTSNMQGGAEMDLSGTIYLPSQALHLTGGGELAADLTTRMFVVNSLQMNGNGQIRLKGDPALMSIPGAPRLVK